MGGDDDAALAAAIAASMQDVPPARGAKPTAQADQPFLSSTGPAETEDVSGIFFFLPDFVFHFVGACGWSYILMSCVLMVSAALHQRRNSGRRGVDGYGESAPSAGMLLSILYHSSFLCYLLDDWRISINIIWMNCISVNVVCNL